MKLALIGFGQAGGKLVDEFIRYERSVPRSFISGVAAINTASVDLCGLCDIPESQRVLIGQSQVKGHGVGADNELGASIAAKDIDDIQHAIDSIPVHDIDAFLLVAGLGGGTGSGGAPVLARHLKRIYNEPVYGLAIVPARDEGSIYSLNAARSLQTFLREVDSLLVFDNDAWRRSGESIECGYDRINRDIVHRFGTLFTAGEATSSIGVGESVVDASEVINTLDGGIATVGYADEHVSSNASGLLDRFRSSSGMNGETQTTEHRMTTLVRKAALGRLTLPCEISSAERALVMVSGPPDRLSRKGFERSRNWIEEETGSMEVRGGDNPKPGSETVSATVVLSGVTDVPRVKRLQEIAIEAKQATEKRRSAQAANLDRLLDTSQELEALF